ncbi:MAG: protein kinase [Acidobacteriota bacterium]
MAHNNWHRIEELFHDAKDLSADEQAAFLARECAGDDELRADVESLLAADDDPEFLANPAFGEGLKVISTDNSEILCGRIIGGYKIEKLLGKGGMGEVYLAENPKLGRPVALKFLARHLAKDAKARRQLTKEAQAVAQLDHPNICVVHDFVEADGYSFIVMQYIEGESLSDLIQRGALKPEQTLSLALQMASALAEAHAHGVIHRDIKPHNIMLTPNGQLKILDFGLAKVTQGKNAGLDALSQYSQAGLIVGTIAYMSPEQLRGERLDERTDIFSLGAVFYELVSRKHPFAKDNNAETISAILNTQPDVLPYTANGLSHGFGRIVKKCLEKNKEQRYESASALLVDLQNLQNGIEPTKPLRDRKPLLVAAALALLVVASIYFYYRWTAVPTLAVLPFRNESAGQSYEYIFSGLPESLAKQLSRLSPIKIKAPSTLSSKPEQDAEFAQIGKQLGADTLLAGKALTKDGIPFLEVFLLETSSATRLWASTYQLGNTDALTLQKQLAAETMRVLSLRLSKEDKRRMELGQPRDPEAFQAYLRGRHFWNQRDVKLIKDALKEFQRAIDLDPTYALAHTGLADSYQMLTTTAYGGILSPEEAANAANRAAQKALEIDPTLPEAHTSLGLIRSRYEWDWAGAEQEFKQAIQYNPDYAQAHYGYSNLLLITGHAADGLRESELARTLDPFSPSISMNRCRALFLTSQYDRASACFNEILEKKPTDQNARYILGLVYVEKRRYEDAIALFENLAKSNEALALPALGYAYCRQGKRSEAYKVLTKLEEIAKKDGLPPLEFALIYIGLEDRDKAFQYLEKAHQQRLPALTYLSVEPLFRSLYDDPRFTALLQRMKLPLPQA